MLDILDTLFSCVSSSTIFALKLWKTGEGVVLGSVPVDQSPCLYVLSDSLSHFQKNRDAELSAMSTAVNWNLALGGFLLQQFSTCWKKVPHGWEIKLLYFIILETGLYLLLCFMQKYEEQRDITLQRVWQEVFTFLPFLLSLRVLV